MERKEVKFRVELYNVIGKGRTQHGSPRISKWWLVVRVVGGCRAETVKSFAGDEEGARKFCDSLNRDFGVKGV